MKDLHAEKAAQLFGIKPEDVTPEQRNIGKRTNFLELYSAKNVTVGEAHLCLNTAIQAKNAKKMMRKFRKGFDFAEIEQRLFGTKGGSF